MVALLSPVSNDAMRRIRKYHSHIAIQDLDCDIVADTGILVEMVLLTCGRCRGKELAIHNGVADLRCFPLVGKTRPSCVVEGDAEGFAEEARPQMKGLVKEASFKYLLLFDVAIVSILPASIVFRDVSSLWLY
jgi:hypothetical protein